MRELTLSTIDTELFHGWLWPVGAALAAVLAALVGYLFVRPVVWRFCRNSPVAAVVVRQLDRPLKWLLPLLAVQLVLQGVDDGTYHIDAVRHFIGVLVIAAFTATAVAAVEGVAQAVAVLHPADVADNLEARRILTQTRVLTRIGSGAILVAGLAFILMTFPTARQLGTSLLASAGVSALVIGIAARSVLGNLLAGLQIALTQPLRIDDVLIVQGEWGRVEEITSTYVVLKIWDERRLVIPLQWFMDNPFQNWTRTTSQIIGSVFLWVDYATDLESLRAEAVRLAQGSKDYDGRVCLLQVTDTSERAIQLRLIVSSASAGQNWDLRCLLREGLVDHLRRHQPGALPRLRAEFERPPQGGAEVRPPAAPAARHAADAAVNDATGMASLTRPTGGVRPPAQPPR
jgi:small-conductance mechanosensitive channel